VIVVDSNVVAYCWLNGPLTAMAQRVFARDPQWHVPVLWRSELRSVLSGACRAGILEWDLALRVLNAAQKALERREHLPSPAEILRVCESSNLSAYDAEFIALARQLGALLVTEDRAILKAFPDTAVTMANFVERAPGIN
jgi:predicted nucleic acid-binding protein